MASMLDAAPQPSGWGAVSNTETPGPRASLNAHDHAFLRSTEPNYHAWLHHIHAAAGCSHPIRLVGESVTTNPATGQFLAAVHTDDMPDGAIYKPCGNRRTSVCPSCAETYRRDAYQLIRAGLSGGKGIPASIARHPAVFVTLTAPSFGLVHTRRTSKTGRALACRPRRNPDTCAHGVELQCRRIHDAGENILGIPLCLDCYDHHAQVVFNHQAAELWRRTTIAINRHLRRIARALGIPDLLVPTDAGSVRRVAPFRLSFGKVAEMQRRGVVHYHAIIRLDGVNPFDRDAVLPPPTSLGLSDLVEAVDSAAGTVRHTTDPHPRNLSGWLIRWGDEGKGRYADIRPVRITGDGDVSDGMVAAYLAKYATKSTETTGHVSRRLTTETIDLYSDPEGTHAERLVDAAWTLGTAGGWSGLRRWAHMLGFGGHFLTKSRRYSVTFRVLREARVIWQRTVEHDQADDDTGTTTLVINTLAYAGAGWRTTGDALLANTAAAMARERQQVAREECSAVL